jgi:hypothetical protein
MTNDPTDPRATPSATAEGEEQDAVERDASQRDDRARLARPSEPDPQDDDAWTEPQSSAQKGAPRDEEEG